MLNAKKTNDLKIADFLVNSKRYQTISTLLTLRGTQLKLQHFTWTGKNNFPFSL